jgi:large subunit ribosomal protein L24
MAQRVKKDDIVVVIAGRDKGRQGRVLRVISETQRVVVEGINVMKRHMRPTPQNPEGGIVEKEMPIHLSNVMPWDSKAEKPTRIRYKDDAEQGKVRVSQKSGVVLED